MIALHAGTRSLRLALVMTALGATARPALLGAQSKQPSPRFMITPFHAPEKLLGWQAADAVRERLADDNPQRILFVIPKDDIVKSLEQSGYPPDLPLLPTDMKSLATFTRADEYIDAVISKTPTGFRLEARLFLGRDASYSQPIPAIEGTRLGEVAGKLSRMLDEVRRQLEDEKSCYTNTRLRKEKEAIQNAKDAIKRYPRATLARVCLLQAMDQSKASKDSMFKVAQEILSIDPINSPALILSASYYKAKGDSSKYIETLLARVRNDPTNTRLVDQVVVDLVLYRREQLAVPIMKAALSENPGEQQLLTTAYKLFYAANAHKDMISAGEELARIDTSFADSAFFFRMSQAYAADSQPSKQAEMFAHAAQKFPANTGWLLLLAQVQRQQGQNQQAMETLKKAVAVDPKTKGVYIQLARAYKEQNQRDSAVAMIRGGLREKDDVKVLGQYTLSIGNDSYKAAMADSTAEAPVRIKEFQEAMVIIQLADSVAPTPTAKFLLGVSAFRGGLVAATEAPKGKSCDMAKTAADLFGIAQTNVALGGSTSPSSAGSIMTALGQYMPIIDNQKKQFCK